MTEQSKKKPAKISATTDDSKPVSPALEKLLAKKDAVLKKKQAELEGIDARIKQELAKTRKKENQKLAAQKRDERKLRNRQMMLLGVAYTYLQETEKDGKIYDQNTDVLNRGLLSRTDRAVFAGRIPIRHRSDQDDEAQDNQPKNPKEEFKATA